MDYNSKIVELEKRIAEVKAILEAPEKDIDYNELLVSTGQMFAEAEYILVQRRERELDELLKAKPTMSANEQKVKVEARCAKEQRVVRRIEQINRALGIIAANKKA